LDLGWGKSVFYDLRLLLPMMYNAGNGENEERMKDGTSVFMFEGQTDHSLPLYLWAMKEIETDRGRLIF
jgi:hypothetical protein